MRAALQVETHIGKRGVFDRLRPVNGTEKPSQTDNRARHFFRARDSRKVADVVAAVFDGVETEKVGEALADQANQG